MTPRKRIVIPAHYLSDVQKYAMRTWFEKKNCPNRDIILGAVDPIYQQLTFMDGIPTSQDDPTARIREADSNDLQMLAQMLAHIIDRDRTLVKWILEKNGQDFPAEQSKWYAICCAAGWIVIQIYYREVLKVGEDE